MKIKELMITDPITVTGETSITEALEIMRTNSIRHLPVVSADNTLEGFLTLSDLKQGLLPSAVGDLTLTDLMIREPICVEPDDDVELAALLFYRNKIGGMPVLENQKVVGIITETDILRIFVDMMGILSSSSRIDVLIDDRPGELKRALEIIHAAGVEIISIGQIARKTAEKAYFFRLTPCDPQPIARALEKEGFHVLDTME